MAAAIETATRAELVTLHDAIYKAEITLRQVVDGSHTPASPGRFTVAEVNAAVDAVEAAVTAVAAV